MKINDKSVPFTLFFKKNSIGKFKVEIKMKENCYIDSMYRMFYYCSSLISVDLSKFDTSNVTNMHSVFRYCCMPSYIVKSMTLRLPRKIKN